MSRFYMLGVLLTQLLGHHQIGPTTGLTVEQRVQTTILPDPYCQGFSHLTVLLASAPYARGHEVDSLKAAVSKGTLNLSFATLPGHYYVQLQTPNCGLRWAVDVLPGANRHFMVKLDHTKNATLTDLVDSDAVLCGMLPGLGIKRVDLVTRGQNEQMNVVASAVIDGLSYYFENAPALSNMLLRVALVGGHSLEIPVSIRNNQKLVLNISTEDFNREPDP